MDAYYTRQAVLPHFTGYSRQRGSGIGGITIREKVSTARSQIN